MTIARCAVTKAGRYAGACVYEGTRFAVCDDRGARLEPCAYLFKASERPKGPMTGSIPRS